MNTKELLKLDMPVIQRLLGCGWGRSIWSKDDPGLCSEPADQIVVLHLDGAPEGTEVRLCKHHADLIEQETTPHDFGADQ